MANQTLENLKKIHKMQSDGDISKFLQEIKTLKNSLDSFSSSLVERRKQIRKTEEEVKVKKENASEKEVSKDNSDKIEAPKKNEVDYNNQRTFANDSNMNRSFSNQRSYQDTQRGFQNNGQRPPYQNNGQRPPYQNNGQRPPYQNNGQRPPYQNNGQRPPYQNNGQRPPYQNNGQRPFQPGQRPPYQNNGQRPPYQNNGQRPFHPGQRPPYQNNGQRPFQPGQKNSGFVSTKVNNFRNFDVPDTNITLPERSSFGNKNKGSDKSRNVPEERKTQLRKGGDFSKNTFISYDGGFEETSMGSRKTIKSKRKEDAIIAPAVTNIFLNSKTILVKDLSEKTKKSVAEIVKQLMLLGIMANINSTIDYETAELVCGELGITVELKLDKTMEEKLEEQSKKDKSNNTEKRPPIVTVMGHVDHGKTSLLDAFRETSVVTQEAGGITQSIGAYQIKFKNEKITFIDTPGHAAFTQMRARGAKSTDIAILVVAADDGIMPQTIEAINHIKAARVPMIVAINKMDKQEANPDRILQQLAEHDILPEEWGGNTIIEKVSAKTGMGLDKLKETILLVAEMEELKADSKAMATGVVIEANLDKGRGPVANIIVQNGTLKVGDSIMSGITYGKVRAMFDEKGKSVKTAFPSTPVSILGLNEVPSSGDTIYAIEESLSKQVIQERIAKIKEERSNQSSGATLDDFMQRVQEGSLKTLNVIVKADTQGSVEALTSTLLTIRNEEAKVNIVHKGVGAVTESDVILAETTGSVVIAFNQKPVPKARNLAESVKVEIKEYKIIYEIIDDLTKVLSGMLSIKYEEIYIGKAEVRVVFKLSTAGKIAGSYVKDGKITRNAIAKVMRAEEEIGVSAVESLKIVKDEKAEVLKGFECGIKLKENIDFKENDMIEFYIKQPIKRG